MEYAEDSGSASGIPATIGRFEITGVLGRGGGGVVLAGRDPTLARTVAIKLIPERIISEAGRARFEREARGMAKLGHPNVVTVFEVGEIDGHPFIAMELVDGQTLRAWQTAATRPWRVVVSIYIEAGRGLAAAHDAGLVHRDFKPDNVLIGADLRPRVSDFGLVSEHVPAEPASEAAASEHWVGTPPYMSREQWRGDRVGPPADQFAFCVSLWEALFGERPFAGETEAEVRDEICESRHRAPPSGHAVPRALVRVLERGLAPEVSDRWPSMHALIAELQRFVRAPNRLLIAGGLAVTALATTVAVIALRGQPALEDSCPLPVARATTVWGAGGREALLAKVRGLDPAQADAHVAAIVRTLDPFVDQWQRSQVEACRATTSPSDPLVLQREACLDERLAFGTGLVQRLRDATTGAELDKVIPALAQLPTPTSCADARTLASFTMPPSPQARTEAAAIAEATRTLELDRLSGKMTGLRERGTALLARARTLDHAPTTARALFTVAHVEADFTSSSSAAALMRELTVVAARAPDDEAAAWAWCNLLRLTSFDEGKTAEALAMLPAAEAAVIRAGDPVELRALFLQQTAEVYMDVERIPDALRALDDARQRLIRAGADAVTSPLHDRIADVEETRGHALSRANQCEKAIEAYTEARRVTEEAYGVGHPLIAYFYINIGVCYRNLGRPEDALAAYATAVKIRRARLGPSPALAWALSVHADAALQTKHPEKLVDEAEEAYAMGLQVMSKDDPQLITITLGAAVVFEAAGNIDRARDMYSSAIEIGERSGAHNVNVPISLLNRGNLARTKGDCRAALVDFERSLALFTEYRGASDYYNLYALRAVATCELVLGKPADALRHLEMALALEAPPRVASELIAIRYLHGTALIRTARDRARGAREIADARAAAVKAGFEELAELDKLLSTSR
jgi:eukaryotic-like serine/threonine-protein kinase